MFTDKYQRYLLSMKVQMKVMFWSHLNFSSKFKIMVEFCFSHCTNFNVLLFSFIFQFTLLGQYYLQLAVPKFSRGLGRVSIFNWSINWNHHMKDHVEIGNLTKYDAFRLNRDQVMNLEIWFKIHTNISNFDKASPKTI